MMESGTLEDDIHLFDDIFLGSGDGDDPLFGDLPFEEVDGIADVAAPCASTQPQHNELEVANTSGVSAPASLAGAIANRGKKRVRTARSNPFHDVAKEAEKQAASAEAERAKRQILQDESHLSIAKRKSRRRSKKVVDYSNQTSDECEEEEHPDSAAKSPKRRRSNSSRRGSNSQKDDQRTDQAEGAQSLSQQQIDQLLQQHREQQAVREERQMRHQAQLYRNQSISKINAAAPPTPTPEETRRLLLTRAQEFVQDFGLRPSRQIFYPFMKLPQQVEFIRKRGLDTFPCVAKLDVGSSANVQAEKNESKLPQSQPQISTEDAGASAMITLFEKHIGALNGTPDESVESLQRSVSNTVQIAENYLKSTNGRKALVDDLGKLYLGCMKQGSFLRQCLYNVEGWCKKNMNEQDFQSVCPVKRKETEWLMHLLRQQHLMDLNPALFRQSLANGLHSNIKGGSTKPPKITIQVKVKVKGWKGRQMHAELLCPKQWKVARKRALSPAVPEIHISQRLDLSSVSKPLLKLAASELLRPDLYPEVKPAPSQPTRKSTDRKADIKTNINGKLKSGDVAKLRGTATQLRDASLRRPSSSMSDRKSANSVPNKPRRPDNHTRFVQVLEQIQDPKTAQTTRRLLITKEIEITIQQLERARSSCQWTTAAEMQDQLRVLEQLYMTDTRATSGDELNTVGLWKYLDGSDYLRRTNPDEVQSLLPLSDSQRNMLTGDDQYWGALPPVNLKTECEIKDEIDFMPLSETSVFDRVQSMLVDVSEDDDSEGQDADYDVIDDESSANANDCNGTESIDSSSFATDERVFVRLRASNILRSDDAAYTAMKRSIHATSIPVSRASDSISPVLKRMKRHLTKLDREIAATADFLRDAAMAQLSSGQNEKGQYDDDKALAEYQKMQDIVKDGTGGQDHTRGNENESGK